MILPAVEPEQDSYRIIILIRTSKVQHGFYLFEAIIVIIQYNSNILHNKNINMNHDHN